MRVAPTVLHTELQGTSIYIIYKIQNLGFDYRKFT